jgi:hypothetical protein
MTSEELERETENFIWTLQEAAKQATPPPNIQKVTKNIPLKIKKLIRAKRKARRKWQHSHNPEDKTTYNQQTNRLKKKLKEAQNDSFYDYVTNLSRHDNSIWRPIKSTSKQLPANPPIRKQSPTLGPWARNNKEKANLFAEHLAEVFTPNDNINNQEIIDFLQHDQVTEEPPIIHTLKEIKKEITHLKDKKAPGLDQISVKMLKELPKKRE